MTTITASKAERTGTVEPRWLKWLSIGFLGFNVLLLMVAFSVWRARQVSDAAVESQPVAVTASTVVEDETAAEAPSASVAIPAAGSEETEAIPAPAVEETEAVGSTAAVAASATELLAEKMRLWRRASVAATAPLATEPPIGDLDKDGDVDIFDVVRYARSPGGIDVNGDGVVNVRDLITLRNQYGTTGPGR